jgi:hypothetical protein
MKKLFLRAEFGPLWEPWEEDEIGRKDIPYLFGPFFSNPSYPLKIYTYCRSS